MVNKRIYEKLKELAKAEKIITYQNLNEELGLGFDFKLSQHQKEIGNLLGEINDIEVKKEHHPMLSVLVVRKENNMPAPSFFSYAEKLERKNTKESDESFFLRELKEVFRVWKKKK